VAILGQIPTEPWTSTAPVQVVNSGSTSAPLEELAAKAKYYIVELQSLPFLNSLKQQIDAQAPQYSHKVEELGQMIDISYDLKSKVPTFDIKATAPTVEETMFLTGFVPKAFQNYLVTQANGKKQQQYEDTLKQIEDVKAASRAATKELDTIKQKSAENNIANTPSQVALNARIIALELQINTQASQMVALDAQGSLSQDNEKLLSEYGDTIQKQKEAIKSSLTKAQNELKALDLQNSQNDIANDPTYVMLNAKIEALGLELGNQANALADIIAVGDENGETARATQTSLGKISTALSDAKKQLAVLQAEAIINQELSNTDYVSGKARVNDLTGKLTAIMEKQGYLDAQAKFEITSIALASARQEQALAMARNSTTLESNVEYQAASGKVESLNNQLTLLNQKLGTSVVEGTATPLVDYSLAVENASVPIPVLPARAKARNALMMGAIIGIGVSWALLNRRWFAKGMSSQPEKEDEDNA
jgi:hypothetical protein